MNINVLLDTKNYKVKPTGKTVSAITRRLPSCAVSISIKDLADKVSGGYSWKASVMSDTTNDSFVFSTLVALDIDNKTSYTSIEEFLQIQGKYKPCFIYETFSSKKDHERYRAVFAFDKEITDYDTMCALYKDVWAQYHNIELDESVNPGKILFGGTRLRYYSEAINTTPQLVVSHKERQHTKSSPVIGVADDITITPEEIEFALMDMADNYADVEVDINRTREWINANLKMSEILDIPENTRFRCILPDHEDNHPSARITTEGGIQKYFCTCEANGYRTLDILAKLLNCSTNTAIYKIFKLLNIRRGSLFQTNALAYIADIKRDLDDSLGDTVRSYLQYRKLYETYRLIVDFVSDHITLYPLGNDDDRIVFFLSERELERQMNMRDIKGASNSNKKLTALCELGLLEKLTDNELRTSTLERARKATTDLEKKISHNAHVSVTDLHRCDFYELKDLSPTVIAKAEQVIQMQKDLAVRQSGNNVRRRTNIFGAEEVSNNIHVQTTINTTKLRNVQNRLEQVIYELFDARDYFSEAELSAAYRNKDKRHITHKKAAEDVLDNIPALIANGIIKRIRVNKTTRKQYDISAGYGSGTYVYVRFNS